MQYAALRCSIDARSMTIIDHIVLIVLAVGMPVDSAVYYHRYLRKIRAGERADPARFYRVTMIQQWVGLAILAIMWLALDRPAADLGFVAPRGTGFYIGVGLLVLIAGLLAYSWRQAARLSADAKAQQIQSLGDLVHFLPRSRREFRLFVFTSVTAGIVEEIFYRGFAIWYLTHFMPLWTAVIVSSLIFGLGHSYQGAAGMLKTGVVGLSMAVLYVITGSIWLPIVAHALFDILQGKTITEILRND